MLVLVVDCFSEDHRGRSVYSNFLHALRKITKSSQNAVDIDYFMERRFNELVDIVVDWEHDHLDKKAEERAKKFDKIDLIVVCGDLSVLPWEPAAGQVVTLIHMAKHMNKPFIGIGFGAFASIYSFSTKGTKFNILNGPLGDSIEQLASFSRYSISTGVQPSGWLDRETGDIYTYNPQSKEWVPKCNIGVHYIAMGTPGSPRAQPPTKKHVSYEDIATSTTPVHKEASSHEAIRFRNNALHHYLLKGLSTSSHHFVVDLYPEWHLNHDSSLPSDEKLKVIGETSKSPVILMRGHMLLLVCKVDHGDYFKNIQQLIANYIHEIIRLNMESKDGKIELLTHTFLFDNSGSSHGKYDTARHRLPMTPALAKINIATSLKSGPVRIDPPPLEMFYSASSRDKDYFSGIGKRRSSSVGRKPKESVQNPLNMAVRKMRLEQALERIGFSSSEPTNDVVEKGLDSSLRNDPFALSDHMPIDAKELLTGRVMKDFSITPRRHHRDYRRKILTEEEIRTLDYTKIFPPTPNPEIQQKLQLSISLQEDSDYLEPIQTHRVTFSAEPRSPISISRPNSTSPPRVINTADNQSRESNKSTLSVPPIANWDKVFFVPNQTSILSSEIQSIATSARSRSSSPRSALGGPNVITPWSPAPPSAAATARSFKSPRTPRTPHAILQEAVCSHYLPIHRPSMKIPVSEPTDPTCDSSEDDDSVPSVPVKPTVPEEVVLVEIPSGIPKSNYNNLQETFQIQDMQAAKEYKSYYTTGFLSDQDKYLREQHEKRIASLAGDFKLYFNKHKTSMVPLQGYIRSEGPYPSAPDFGHPPEMPAIEWPYMRKTTHEEKQKWVAGSWKR
jgi:hypothetical protein